VTEVQTALDTVQMARFARGIGDVPACLSLSDAAVRQAGDERYPDAAYVAAEVPGRMYMGRNEPREAEAHYRYALDLVRLYNLRNRLGGALHDLALAVREKGDYAQFRALSSEAFERYHEHNPRDPCITGLLADVAAGAFERDPGNREKASAALAAWRPVPVSMKTPRYHMAAAAQQMVTAAALGLGSSYRYASNALDWYVLDMPDREAVAMTLVYAAGGSLMHGDFHRAAELAREAERIAVLREETTVAEQAREVLNAALAERPMSA